MHGLVGVLRPQDWQDFLALGMVSTAKPWFEDWR